MQDIRKRVMKAEKKAATTAAALSRGASSSKSPDAERAYNSASLFAARVGVKSGCQSQLTCMQAVSAFFSKSSSNCNQATDVTDADVGDIDSAELKELAGYDGLLCGTPLWSTTPETGLYGAKWNDYMNDLRNGRIDATGKPVAVPGTVNSLTFSNKFCAALTEIHDAFEAVGAKMRGYVGSSSSAYDNSKSEADLGHVLNMDESSDTTQDRVNAWLAQLNTEAVPT